jgi:hypothetical protein
MHYADTITTAVHNSARNDVSVTLRGIDDIDDARQLVEDAFDDLIGDVYADYEIEEHDDGEGVTVRGSSRLHSIVIHLFR